LAFGGNQDEEIEAFQRPGLILEMALAVFRLPACAALAHDHPHSVTQ